MTMILSVRYCELTGIGLTLTLIPSQCWLWKHESRQNLLFLLMTWVGAQTSLSVNGRGCLGYPAASSPREDDIMLMPNLVGHGSQTVRFASVELTDIARAQCRGFGQYLRLSLLKSLSSRGVSGWGATDVVPTPCQTNIMVCFGYLCLFSMRCHGKQTNENNTI
jgi:hypothetical protein